MTRSDWLATSAILIPVLLAFLKFASSIQREWVTNTKLTLEIRTLLQGNPKTFPPTIGVLSRLEKLELKVNDLESVISTFNRKHGG